MFDGWQPAPALWQRISFRNIFFSNTIFIKNEFPNRDLNPEPILIFSRTVGYENKIIYNFCWNIFLSN